MDPLTGELKKYSRIAIDTNLFVYLMERHPKYFDIAKEIFQAIEKGQVFGITSVLLLTEVLTKPLRDQNESLVRSYKAVISTFPNLSVKDIDLEVCTLAATIRANYGLKSPDAIFVATAIDEGAEVFVTNDTRLKKVDEIAFLILDDYVSK